jgi:hypothetical protein
MKKFSTSLDIFRWESIALSKWIDIDELFTVNIGRYDISMLGYFNKDLKRNIDNCYSEYVYKENESGEIVRELQWTMEETYMQLVILHPKYEDFRISFNLFL